MINIEEKLIFLDVAICIKSYSSELEGELKIEKGELFIVLENYREKEYWMVQEYRGEQSRGLVPSKSIIICNKALSKRLEKERIKELDEEQYEQMLKKLETKDEEIKLLKSKISQKRKESIISKNIELNQIDIDPKMFQLTKQGYPFNVLLFLKENLRSKFVRRKFLKVISDYSKHEASKTQRLRMRLINEIISSEKVYVNQLKKAVKSFYEPLIEEEQKNTKGFISRTDINEIFSTLEIIADLSDTFLREMRDRMYSVSNKFSFGDIFIKLAPVFKIYSFYLRNYELGQKILLRRREHNNNFNNFLKEIESKNDPLNFYLILPVQRLPRYEMLLKQVIQNTPETHVDYVNLTKALAKIELTTQEINNLKKQDVNNKTSIKLETKIENLPFKLKKKNREFIWKGPLYITYKPKESSKFYFIIFNDLIIQSKKKLKGKFNYVESWEFNDGFLLNNFEDSENMENAFSIMFDDFNSKKITLPFSSLNLQDKEYLMSRVDNFFDKKPQQKEKLKERLFSPRRQHTLHTLHNTKDSKNSLEKKEETDEDRSFKNLQRLAHVSNFKNSELNSFRRMSNENSRSSPVLFGEGNNILKNDNDEIIFEEVPTEIMKSLESIKEKIEIFEKEKKILDIQNSNYTNK